MRKLYARVVLFLIRPALELSRVISPPLRSRFSDYEEVSMISAYKAKAGRG